MKAAKRRGRHVGWPRNLGPDQLEMTTLMATDSSQRDMAKAFGVSPSTLREAIKEKAA